MTESRETLTAMGFVYLVALIIQGALLGALVTYLSEGVPRRLFIALAVSAGVVCVTSLLIDNVPTAVGAAVLVGLYLACSSNHRPRIT